MFSFFVPPFNSFFYRFYAFFKIIKFYQNLMLVRLLYYCHHLHCACCLSSQSPLSILVVFLLYDSIMGVRMNNFFLQLCTGIEKNTPWFVMEVFSVHCHPAYCCHLLLQSPPTNLNHHHHLLSSSVPPSSSTFSSFSINLLVRLCWGKGEWYYMLWLGIILLCSSVLVTSSRSGGIIIYIYLYICKSGPSTYPAIPWTYEPI